MQIIIDIGNSNIVIGIYQNSNWVCVWRLPTSDALPDLGYEMRIRQLMLDHAVSTDQVSAIAMSSVVPGLTNRLGSVWKSLTGIEPLVINPMRLGRNTVKLNNPIEIGSDLVANAVAGFQIFKQKCLIVDFGTALTFTTVSDREEVIGVSIVPGIKTAIKALTENTAKLPQIDLEIPNSALGQDTVHAIRSGILFGYVGLVKEMIARNKAEVGDDLMVVATGGLSKVLHPLRPFFNRVEPNLTLDGIRLLADNII